MTRRVILRFFSSPHILAQNSLFRLRSQYFQRHSSLYRFKNCTTLFVGLIAYTLGIDMCYDITFLETTVGLNDATLNLKWVGVIIEVIEAAGESLWYIYNGREYNAVWVSNAESNAQIFSWFTLYLNFDCVCFQWINTMNYDTELQKNKVLD